MELVVSDDQLIFAQKMIDKVKPSLESRFGAIIKLSIVEYYRNFTFKVEIKLQESSEFVIFKSLYHKVEDNELVLPPWGKVLFPKLLATYQHIEDVAGRLTANLLFYDEEYYLLIFEFLEGIQLHEILLSEDFELAKKSILGLVSVLARLHATTRGTLKSYSEKVMLFGGELSMKPHWHRLSDNLVEDFVKGLKHIDFQSYKGLAEAATQIIQQTNNSTFLSLIHGDSCLDNLFYYEDKLLFIDLDTVSYYSPFIDLIYLNFPLPSCWCVGKYPLDIIDSAFEVYKTTYREYHELGDEEFELNMFYAHIIMIVASLKQQLTLEDGQMIFEKYPEWGTSKMKIRICTWIDSVISYQNSVSGFDEVFSSLIQLKTHLKNMWGEWEVLPLFNAFTHELQ